MLEWTASAQQAFQDAKPLLAVAVPLQHPPSTAELSFATDRYLYQRGHATKIWIPLAPPCFFSHKLTDTESRYSTFDRELLATQAALSSFL